MGRGYDLGTIISVIKTDIMELINVKIEYYKLEIYEKTSAVGSFLVYGLIIMNLIFFAFLFAFMALGFLIGGWIGSLAGGFGIVTLLYLAILAILFGTRKSIIRTLQNMFLKELDPDLEDEAKYEEKSTRQRQRMKKEREEYMQNHEDEFRNKYTSYECD